jgi:hypothetical protein
MSRILIAQPENGANERSRSDMLGSAIVGLEVISKAAASGK